MCETRPAEGALLLGIDAARCSDRFFPLVVVKHGTPPRRCHLISDDGVSPCKGRERKREREGAGDGEGDKETEIEIK